MTAKPVRCPLCRRQTRNAIAIELSSTNRTVYVCKSDWEEIDLIKIEQQSKAEHEARQAHALAELVAGATINDR